jgi:hypothetical protein
MWRVDSLIMLKKSELEDVKPPGTNLTENFPSVTDGDTPLLERTGTGHIC